MKDITLLLIIFFVAYYIVMIGLMVYFYQMGIAYVEILRKEEDFNMCRARFWFLLVILTVLIMCIRSCFLVPLTLYFLVHDIMKTQCGYFWFQLIRVLTWFSEFAPNIINMFIVRLISKLAFAQKRRIEE